MFKFGVDTFIWTEDFSENDLDLIDKAKKLGFKVLDIAIANPEKFPTEKVRNRVDKVGIEVVTSTTLNKNTNIINPDASVRKKGVETLKKLVDINIAIGSTLLGGVNYAAWGYLTGCPRVEDEWQWSLESMREICQYAADNSGLIIAVEPVNRFETHFLNIAKDAVAYCKNVGIGNIKVHLDSFHMIREELSFKDAVKVCGKKYLGYIHVCESNRGIPGTGLVPWKEFFSVLKAINYDGFLVIESFDPCFKELNRLCAIWRKFAETGEELAVKGLKNLKEIERNIV